MKDEKHILDEDELETLENMKELLFSMEQESWNWAICDVSQNFLSEDILREVMVGSAPTWQEAYIEALTEIQAIEQADDRDPFSYAVINLSPGCVPFMWIKAQEGKEEGLNLFKKLGFGEDMKKMADIRKKNPDDITKEDAEDMMEIARSSVDYAKQVAKDRVIRME